MKHMNQGTSRCMGASIIIISGMLPLLLPLLLPLHCCSHLHIPLIYISTYHHHTRSGLSRNLQIVIIRTRDACFLHADFDISFSLSKNPGCQMLQMLLFCANCSPVPLYTHSHLLWAILPTAYVYSCILTHLWVVSCLKWDYAKNKRW